VKVEATVHGDRKVYSVSAFNRGVADWLMRLPSLWVEGEVTELRRHERWGSVFFTLKDPGDGSCLPASIPRRTFDALDLGLADGERVHVFGRPELFAGRAEFRLRALSIERFGEGAHLAALERLKRRLAAEGLFAVERKRPLPRLPRRVGIVTGSDAAARGDLVATISQRFPPARIVVAETLVQGPRAAAGIVEALQALCREPEVDVLVVARGGGSLEDLLPFSDEAVVRAIAACPVPVVSAVGHEQDTPLCDLAADARASTPTAAARLVVPDVGELHERLARAHAGLERGARRLVERDGQRLELVHARLGRAPALLVERRRAALDRVGDRLRALSPRATLERGYAIVRSGETLVTESKSLEPGGRVDVELAAGSFGATVEDVRPA
jgi:exodeoxyribonuclease VII large subunit